MVFSDVPESIVQTYQRIVDNGPISWLLLASEHDVDSVTQVATGTQGLDELKKAAENNVFFAFLREQHNNRNCFVFIVFIPEFVSGVRRARALVQSRRIGNVFKARQVTLTVSDLEHLTTDVIHQAFADRLNSFATRSSVVNSPTSSSNKELPSSPEDMRIRRSVSEGIPRSSAAAPVSSPTTPTRIPATTKSNVLSNFMRRKKIPDLDADELADASDSFSPPPPPPKDKGKGRAVPLDLTPSLPPHPTSYGNRGAALNQNVGQSALSDVPSIPSPTSADFEHVPPPHRLSPWKELGDDEVVLSPGESSSPQRSQKPGRKFSKSEQALMFDPKERARRRIEAQRRKEVEEAQAKREEAEKQEQLRLERLRALEEEKEEEERRRALAAAEAKKAADLRAGRARELREAEERKAIELQERKLADRERRREESRISEEWRRQQAKQAEEIALRKQQEEKRAEEIRKARIKAAEVKIRNTKSETARSGWVSVQTNESLAWKRRFYKINGTVMVFHRTPEDLGQLTDRIELKGVKALKEWNQGYEELEAIPHSFAVEFKDGQGSWSMFADSAEEKVKLLGLLHQAAGLQV